MKERIKKEALVWLRLIPHAVAVIIGWEIGKWLFF